jgi:hypothetical protein
MVVTIRRIEFELDIEDDEFSGILRRVVWYKLTNVSKKRIFYSGDRGSEFLLNAPKFTPGDGYKISHCLRFMFQRRLGTLLVALTDR